MNCVHFPPLLLPFSSLLLLSSTIVLKCYRPSLKATSPNAISSRSALLGSRGLLLTDILTGGIFSFPGSSLRIFFTRLDLLLTFRFAGSVDSGCISVFGAGSSVSSKTTVARPPIPSPRRMDGVRFRGARLGAQDDIHVVSRDGFCMFFVTGDKGA
jgi:hypothetical protein